MQEEVIGTSALASAAEISKTGLVARACLRVFASIRPAHGVTKHCPDAAYSVVFGCLDPGRRDRSPRPPRSGLAPSKVPRGHDVADASKLEPIMLAGVDRFLF